MTSTPFGTSYRYTASVQLDREAFERFWARIASHPRSRRRSLVRLEADLHGSCEFPIALRWHSYTNGDKVHRSRHVVVGEGAEMTNQIEASVPCRKCDSCRNFRQMTWAERAVREFEIAPRTWFGTLTFKPEKHVMALEEARVELALQGFDFDALRFDEQLLLRHQRLTEEVTLFLKRVRSTLVPIRYLCVMEAHKSGLPHYHMLLHEVSPAMPVRWQVLTDKWLENGHSMWKLVSDPAQCAYVAKYLGKNTTSRVRSSFSYGDGTPDLIEDGVRANVTQGAPQGDLRPPTAIHFASLQVEDAGEGQTDTVNEG